VRVAVALYSAVLALLAIGFALLAVASGSSGDAWLIGRGLFFSAAAGVGAVACALRAGGRSAGSWLLTIGLTPAVAVLLWLPTQ
jgi:hypothetical protein